jgi:hypothetical protein
MNKPDWLAILALMDYGKVIVWADQNDSLTSLSHEDP